MKKGSHVAKVSSMDYELRANGIRIRSFFWFQMLEVSRKLSRREIAARFTECNGVVYRMKFLPENGKIPPRLENNGLYEL